MSEGQGSVTFSTPPGAGGIAVTGARSGLSVDSSGYIILGQAIGASGDPAVLLQNTEIDNGGFYLNLRGNGTLVLSDTAITPPGAKLAIQTITDEFQLQMDYSGTNPNGGFYMICTRGGFGGPAVVNISGDSVSTTYSLGDPVTGDATISMNAQDNFTGGGPPLLREQILVSPNYNISAGSSNTITSYLDEATFNNSGGTNLFTSFWSNNFVTATNNTDTYVGFRYSPQAVAGPTYVAFENTIGNCLFCTTPAGGVGAGRVAIRGTTPSAWLHLGPGNAAASSAPFKFTTGALQTTPEVGAMEFNSNQLYFTLVGGTRSQIFTGVSGAAAPATTAGTTFSNFYGTNSTNILGNPVSWASAVIAGTTYKIPLYT